MTPKASVPDKGSVWPPEGTMYYEQGPRIHVERGSYQKYAVTTFIEHAAAFGRVCDIKQWARVSDPVDSDEEIQFAPDSESALAYKL